jgi:hypothetical protein
MPRLKPRPTKIIYEISSAVVRTAVQAVSLRAGKKSGEIHARNLQLAT